MDRDYPDLTSLIAFSVFCGIAIGVCLSALVVMFA